MNPDIRQKNVKLALNKRHKRHFYIRYWHSKIVHHNEKHHDVVEEENIIDISQRKPGPVNERPGCAVKVCTFSSSPSILSNAWFASWGLLKTANAE